MDDSRGEVETYGQMAQAIAPMGQDDRSRPDLAPMAPQGHGSEDHPQRLFAQGAGMGPEQFLPLLSVEYAQAKIAETKGWLDRAAVEGSDPGQGLDRRVRLEAMAPGVIKAGGSGLEIAYGLHPTPFGYGLIATTQRGICNLIFLDREDPALAEQTLRRAWPQAKLRLDSAWTQGLCDRIFSTVADQHPPIKPIHLWVRGTPFQLQVWRALIPIPGGGLITYRDLAQAIGRPTAARAVGNAVGQNPVGYLIPCHRVIRQSGELGGYRWGLERKAALLAWEASRAQNR